MLYLWAASLLWAFSFGLIKTRLAGVDPLLVATVRLALAALVFLPWTWRRAPRRRVRYQALGCGAVQFGLMYALYITSYQYLPAYGVALWTVTTPLFVVFLADARRRRLARRHAAAALLAVAGAAVVLVHGSPVAAWPGVLLVQGANLCFAGGQLAYPRLAVEGTDGRLAGEVGLLGWMYLGGAAFAAAGFIMLGASDAPTIDGGAAFALIYLGLVPTAVGFALWNRGAARSNPGILAVSNNLKVPLAVLVAWVVFGEQAQYLRMLLGLALLAAATLLATGTRRASAAGR